MGPLVSRRSTMSLNQNAILGAAWVPGLPHLLHPEKSTCWEKLRTGYQELAARVKDLKPDLLVVYSSQWLSVLGTSFQGHPHPKGVHVDDNWYEWGDLPFDFSVDSKMSESFAHCVRVAGVPTKTVSYD